MRERRIVMNERRIAWRAAYLLAACGIYLADQASKAWAVRSLRFGQIKTLINGFLMLQYAENPGIAFGRFQEGGSFGRWLLIVLAVGATVAVLVYFFRTPRSDDRVLGACALLLAGILGNLTDRVRLGLVIDFIVVQLGSSYRWPNFNVADASICAGALLLAFDMIFAGRRREQRMDAKQSQIQEAGANSPQSE
jgi:signal peptidase II